MRTDRHDQIDTGIHIHNRARERERERETERQREKEKQKEKERETETENNKPFKKAFESLFKRSPKFGLFEDLIDFHVSSCCKPQVREG